jgi:hypothetical protein
MSYNLKHIWYDETKYYCKWVRLKERKYLKKAKRKLLRQKYKKELIYDY